MILEQSVLLLGKHPSGFQHCMLSCSIEAICTIHPRCSATTLLKLEHHNRALNCAVFYFHLHFFANLSFATGE